MSDKTYLDWPFLEKQHKNLALALDSWAAEHIPPITDNHEAHENVDATCRKLVSLLGEAGWLAYAVPKAFGGVHDELDVRSLSIIRETLARYSGLADFAFAMQGLGTGAISLFGSQELKEKYLRDVAMGRKISAFALSEDNAGSDVANMSTVISQTDGGYHVNGHKTWISNGGIADFYVTFGRFGEADKKFAAVVIEADDEGFSIDERIDVIAPHPLAKLGFRDCIVPAERLVGGEGQGMKIALSVLDIFRTTVGAAALGFARRALDEAIARAGQRKIFADRLVDLQLTQTILAEMALEIDAAALLIYRSAWIKDVKKNRVTREAAMAKLFSTDHAQTIIDKAVQIFGGLGVKKGVKVEELYREIRALRIYEGASEVQKIVIARQLLSE